MGLNGFKDLKVINPSLLMIESIIIEEEGGISATVNLMPVTLITGPPGSGKSRLLNIIWNTLSGIGGDAKVNINWLGKVSITLRVAISGSLEDKFTKLGLKSGEEHIEYIIEHGGKSLKQVIKSGNNTLLVLEADGSRSMMTHPIEVPVINAWGLISDDSIKVPEHEASILIGSNEELLESLRTLVEVVKNELINHRVHVMGPYFEYDINERRLDHVNEIGRNGEGVIRALAEAFMDPKLNNEIGLLRKALAKLGYKSFRVGLFNGALTIGFMDSRGIFRVGRPLPCHLKTMLAVLTQVILMNKGDLLLIDNLDYCMSNESWDVLMSTLTELAKDKFIIAEVHNYELAKRISMNSAIYSIISL